MKELDNNSKVFFALLRAGLWEQGVRLSPYSVLDLKAVREIAEEQSAMGLIAAGLGHVEDTKIEKKDVISFIGAALQLEKRNLAMNSFIGTLLEKMREAGINLVLVKGQGIAQCYERPLWRASGDIDFLLDEHNYQEAKAFLSSMASEVEKESEIDKHLGMSIGPWLVEIHGALRTGLSKHIDRVIDQVQEDTFVKGHVRNWNNSGVDVALPAVDNDVIFIFTHFLKHFYKGGLGIRQVCDWCRLMWKNREDVDLAKLEYRLKKMHLVSEWKAFAAFAVDYLGMPGDAMPLFDSSSKWRKKARKICSFMLSVGNFGHNRDFSYYLKYPYLIRKIVSMNRRIKDIIRHAGIFPLDSFRFFPNIIVNGLRSATDGI